MSALRTTCSVSICRTTRDVFQFVALDFFENYRKWSPEVRELEKITAGQMRIGVAGRQVRYDAGHRSEALFQVTRLVPFSEVRFSSRSRPNFDASYLFEHTPHGTRLTFSFRLELPFLMLPLSGRIRDAMDAGGRRVVSNLKALLEADAAKS